MVQDDVDDTMMLITDSGIAKTVRWKKEIKKKKGKWM